MHIVARIGTFMMRNWLLMLTLAVLLGFITIHLVWYIHPSEIESPEELYTVITGGEPVVVEYYTNL